MIELVFTACLLATGGDCNKVTIQLDEEATVHSCMKEAPERIKEWQTEHQDKMVAGFSCKQAS